MFVCVLEDGGGAVLQTLELFNDINVFGVWGGGLLFHPKHPPCTPTLQANVSGSANCGAELVWCQIKSMSGFTWSK